MMTTFAPIPDHIDPDGRYSPAQVAARLGVTTNALAIWRYYRRGLTFIKAGRSVMYRGKDIIDFEEANTIVCRPEIHRLRPGR
jgi:hypothetical protein